MNGWDGHRLLTLECPSGDIYLETPTNLAMALEGALVEGRGRYQVYVAWRNRGARGEHGSTVFGESEADEAVMERYLVQLWRTGELSPETAAEFADDEDD